VFGNPSKVKKQLEKQGKKVYVLSFDEFSGDKIEGLKLDMLINLACPRIGTDDLERIKIPLINWYQVVKEKVKEKA
jgi:2-(3-amino-3-carboxypropyl)histidine synthase